MKVKPMRHMVEYPSQKVLEHLFAYTEIDGVGFLKRRVARGVCKVGDIVGSIHHDRNGFVHYRTQIDGLEYKISRLVYIIIRGSVPEGMLIGHKDGDPLNNSICNLIPITISQNASNKKL